MGPWSRSFIAAVAGNAERPEMEVDALRIDAGTIWAIVEGCEVTISAPVIPKRIWTAMARYAQGMGQLEDAVEGKLQSVHLEHLLEEDWDEQLVPRAGGISRACTCDGQGCQHVVAAAYAFADELETTPRLLLRWRGVGDQTGADDGPTDPWDGGETIPAGPARSMPPYAVIKRLGPSGLAVGGDSDLARALRAAYDALGA